MIEFKQNVPPIVVISATKWPAGEKEISLSKKNLDETTDEGTSF